MKPTLKNIAVLSLAIACVGLSLLLIVLAHSREPQWDALIGGLVALLFPFLDALRRQMPRHPNLVTFLRDSVLSWLPILAVARTGQTLPFVVMAVVFLTSAFYCDYPTRLVNRLLIVAVFLLLWGLAGRLLVGSAWMNLSRIDLWALCLMVPIAVSNAFLAEKYYQRSQEIACEKKRTNQ